MLERLEILNRLIAADLGERSQERITPKQFQTAMQYDGPTPHARRLTFKAKRGDKKGLQPGTSRASHS